MNREQQLTALSRLLPQVNKILGGRAFVLAFQASDGSSGVLSNMSPDGVRAVMGALAEPSVVAEGQYVVASNGTEAVVIDTKAKGGS